MSAEFYNTRSAATIIRPADTTAYAVGDVINSTAPAAVPINLSLLSIPCYLTRALLLTDKSNHTEALRLHLYRSLPSVSTSADNSAYLLASADESLYIGYLDFTTFVTGGSGSTMAVSEAAYSKPLQIHPLTGAVFGMLEARATFTPNSGQRFTLNLCAEVPYKPY